MNKKMGNRYNPRTIIDHSKEKQTSIDSYKKRDSTSCTKKLVPLISGKMSESYCSMALKVLETTTLVNQVLIKVNENIESISRLQKARKYKPVSKSSIEGPLYNRPRISTEGSTSSSVLYLREMYLLKEHPMSLSNRPDIEAISNQPWKANHQRQIKRFPTLESKHYDNKSISIKDELKMERSTSNPRVICSTPLSRSEKNKSFYTAKSMELLKENTSTGKNEIKVECKSPPKYTNSRLNYFNAKTHTSKLGGSQNSKKIPGVERRSTIKETPIGFSVFKSSVKQDISRPVDSPMLEKYINGRSKPNTFYSITNKIFKFKKEESYFANKFQQRPQKTIPVINNHNVRDCSRKNRAVARNRQTTNRLPYMKAIFPKCS